MESADSLIGRVLANANADMCGDGVGGRGEDGGGGEALWVSMSGTRGLGRMVRMEESEGAVDSEEGRTTLVE